MRLTGKVSAMLVFVCLVVTSGYSQRVMEKLGRGFMAVKSGNGYFLTWRLFGTEQGSAIGFNVYKGSVKLNTTPITNATCYQDNSTGSGEYTVRAVVDGVEEPAAARATVLANNYLEIPLRSAPNTFIHLAWVGDLDGDGEYDYVVDRIPTGTSSQFVDAYKRDGTFLWRVDMGPNSTNMDNIEPGPATISVGHNDGVTVYDIDLDGRAEVIIKAANGTVFGDGKRLTHTNNTSQFIVALDGLTGAERARIMVPEDYAADGPLSGHMGIGYFDGVRPSVVFKGKNRIGSGAFNLMVVAWDMRNGVLVQRWKWLRGSRNAPDFHQIRLVDIDGDGKDELCDGGYVLDDNGTFLYAIPGVVHGDRFHIGDLDPDRPGLEGFGIQQSNGSGLQIYYYDAKNGSMLRAHTGEVTDMARGIAGDVDPRRKGYEYWSFSGMFNVQTLSGGAIVNDPNTPWPNFRIWWDGDLLSESLNQNWVAKWDYQNPGRNNFVFKTTMSGLYQARDAVPLYGDFFGDWREEVLLENSAHTAFRIYTTTYPTTTRIYTLPHNPEYRNCLTVKGYMQSHMVDFYLGDGMAQPPKPSITYPGIVTTAPDLALAQGRAERSIRTVRVMSGGQIRFSGTIDGMERSLSIYTCNGRLVRALVTRNETINLAKDYGLSENVYLVRIKAVPER